jgi:hypothetical protein
MNRARPWNVAIPAFANSSSRFLATGSVNERLKRINSCQSMQICSALIPFPFIRRTQSTASAAPTRTFFGSHPRSLHVPPNGRESITATCHPADRHRDDTLDAASPVPITTRSNFLVTPSLLPSLSFLRSIQNCCLTIVCFSQNRAMSGPLAQIIAHDDAHRHHDCDGALAAVSAAFGLEGALFRRLLLDPIAALCKGNDPEWRRYICGIEERCIGLVIGEILIDAPERVLG